MVDPRPRSGLVVDYEPRVKRFFNFPRKFLSREVIKRKRTNFEVRCLPIRGVVLLAMNLLQELRDKFSGRDESLIGRSEGEISIYW